MCLWAAEAFLIRLRHGEGKGLQVLPESVVGSAHTRHGWDVCVNVESSQTTSMSTPCLVGPPSATSDQKG